MAFIKVKTDRRLWFWISLVLFVIPWLLPIYVLEGHAIQPIVFWARVFYDPSIMDEGWGGNLIIMELFSLHACIPAVALGWILQWFIVLARGRRENKTKSKLNLPNNN